MRTAAGRYEFTTLKPSPIQVDQTDLSAQIHFKVSYKVSYQDHKPLFTRLLFAGDPLLNNTSPGPELTTRLNEQVEPTGLIWQGSFDVILHVSAPQP